MNILHLTNSDINSDSRILKEMNSISASSSQYHVIGIGVDLDEEPHKTINVSNIEIYSIKLFSRKWNFIPKTLRHAFTFIELTSKMLLKGLKLKPQIIHCHDTLVLPLGVMIKILTKSKLVYDAHELESDRNSLTKTLGRIILSIEKILWRFVDRLIVVSPSISDWYQKNVGPKQTEIILNSPQIKMSSDNADKLYFRKKFKIPKNSRIFLYIGILGGGRGIDLVVEAFKNPDLSSHVVFLGYGQMKGELKRISNEYSNVHVHDAVPHEEVVSVAKSADVGLCFVQNVSLSDYYCLPNKLFEYAFAEIPVLASNFPDISTTVIQFKLGKCSDLDSNSIYKTIKEFESMENLPKIDSKCLHDLSWTAQSEKLVHLYKGIASEIEKGEQ